MPTTRRQLLRTAALGGAAVALGSGPGRRVALAAERWAPSAPAAEPDGILVVITLDGGNDALNTVAPVEDGRYRERRGALALDPAACHPLTDGFALHPSLTGTKALWDAGRLSVVHGVGFDGLDRSHFHCRDVWQAGDEEDRGTGWLGRWLDATGRDPLDAIAVGTGVPLALRGATRSAVTVRVGPIGLPGDDALRRRFALLNAPDPDRPPLAALVAGSTVDLVAAVERLQPVLAGFVADDGLDEALGGGRRDLGAALDVVATTIEAGLPARAYAVRLSGFDTHARQAPAHAALLAQVDAALSSFLARVADRPVTCLLWSEFGRRLAANGSGGTDHGGAGTVLLAGRVRPGMLGDPPPLDRLENGDLVTTTDFRAVYGGLVEGVLGHDVGDLYPAWPRPLTVV